MIAMAWIPALTSWPKKPALVQNLHVTLLITSALSEAGLRAVTNDKEQEHEAQEHDLPLVR